MLPRMGNFLPCVSLGFLEKKKYYLRNTDQEFYYGKSLQVTKVEKYTLIFTLQKNIINHKPIILKFNGQAQLGGHAI